MGGGGSKGDDGGGAPKATAKSDAIMSAPPTGGFPERPTTSMEGKRSNKDGSTNLQFLSSSYVSKLLNNRLLLIGRCATRNRATA